MLSYDNRPHVLANGHSNSVQVSSGKSAMGNTMATLDNPSGDHIMSNGLHKPTLQQHPNTEHRHIWLITGPAGCGKSTVAQYIAKSLKLPYIEGDEVRCA
jgi:ABC-type dipeptide/oligopeptide/nickel transport system ATPase subunit